MFIERHYFKRQVSKGKQYTSRKLRALIFSIRLFVLLVSVLLFLFPFEAPFLHFNSIEDSLRYKWIDSKDITVHVEKDCAFAVRGTYEIFAFGRSEKGFSFVNYNSTKCKYYASNENIDNSSIYNLYSVYQKSANKTFYLLDLGISEYQEELFESDNLDFNNLAHPDSKNNMFNKAPIVGSLYQLFAINNGEPIPEINVRYNDQHKSFTKKIGLYINSSQ